MMPRVMYCALLLFSELLNAEAVPPGQIPDHPAMLTPAPLVAPAPITPPVPDLPPTPGQAGENAPQLSSALPANRETQKTDTKPARISDPTQMTGSFSQALDRVSGKSKTGPGGNLPGLAADNLPDIVLVAKLIKQRGDKSALVRAGGRNYLVKEGGKLTFMENKTLHQLQIDSIESDHVDVTLLPANKRMLLK